MVAYTFRMPSGIPGDVNRSHQATVEPGVIDAANAPTAYGVPVKFVGGLVRPLASGDAAALIRGWLVRPFPTQSASNPLGGAVPSTTQTCDVMRRGYMTVFLARGVAARDAAVYIRITADTGKLVGDLETAADAGNCVLIPGALFRGPADAQGNVEIEYNL